MANEVVRIEIDKSYYEELRNEDVLPLYTHKVIGVNLKEEIFENDPMYDALKKESDKAFKKLEEYKFKKRHGI